MSESKITRRGFLSAIVGGFAALTVLAISKDEIMRFLEPVPKDEVNSMIKSLEEELRRRYGRDDIRVKNTPAPDGVVFAMALNISRCIGCRRCVYACVLENNIGRNSGIQWIRVVEVEGGTLELTPEATSHYYTEAPKTGKVYIPIACQHCEDPPCVKVCPVIATWKEKDGIVVINYHWCIGCRYCIASCPYQARGFNWFEPYIPPDELNPDMHFLGNIPRMRGVVEKCTWCIHRTREGRLPACVEACPTGARVFGNLLDPESPVRKAIESKRVFRLKEHLGTKPKFFYIMDEE